MQMFLTLLKKDLRQSLLPVALYIGFTLVVYALATQFQDPRAVLMFPLASLPLAGLLFYIPWRSLSLWRREWQGNHSLLLLSLPVPGWQQVLVKLLTVVIEVVAILPFATTVSYLQIQGALGGLPGLGAVAVGLLQSTYPYALLPICFAMALLVQSAYLASRLYRRFRWLLFGSALLVEIWAFFRLGSLLSVPLRRLLPFGVPFTHMEINDGHLFHYVRYLHPAPLLVSALIVGAVLWLVGRWVERDLEG